MPTIYLFNLYHNLFFLERNEVYKFVNIRACITQNKTLLFMVAVSAVKRSLWLWVSTAEAFKRKKIKTSKHEQISSYQWVVSVSLFPPNCVAVVILRRFFIYDVNFVYNALCFLRLASRSSVNHKFIVLNKHFLYLVVAKFPALFSSPFARFLLWAQGTENIKVLNHRFSYY